MKTEAIVGDRESNNGQKEVSDGTPCSIRIYTNVKKLSQRKMISMVIVLKETMGSEIIINYLLDSLSTCSDSAPGPDGI